VGILKTALFLVLAVLVGARALAWASSQSAPRHPASEVASAVAQTETAVAPEVTIELDEATLSSELNAQLAGRSLAQTPLGPATARALAVHLGDGQLEVTGTAQAGAVSAPINLTAVVEVQARRILVQVRDVRMGGVALPEVSRRGVEQVLQDQVDREIVQHRVTPRSATITQGKLVLVGTPA
jgi:hypothetical protein